MLSRDPEQRCGFKGVEALIVCAIVGTLAGVVTTGVLKARKAARRIECANNMRKIGFGVQELDSANQFPWEGPSDAPPPHNKSLFTQILDKVTTLESLEMGRISLDSRLFQCPGRATPPDGCDFGYLKSDGTTLKAPLDTPGTTVGKIADTAGTAATAILGHVWVSSDKYKQRPTSAGWAAPYPAHAKTDTSRIFEDFDGGGSQQSLGTPHANMIALFADNHIGNIPLTYPHLASLFSLTHKVPQPGLP